MRGVLRRWLVVQSGRARVWPSGVSRLFGVPALAILSVVAVGCGAVTGTAPGDESGALDAAGSSEDAEGIDGTSAQDGQGSSALGEAGDKNSANGEDGAEDGSGADRADRRTPIVRIFNLGLSEEKVREQEEYTQACMRRLGFEYTPQDPASLNLQDPYEWPESSTEEFSEEWGFGITTQAFPQSAVGADLLGLRTSSDSPPTPPPPTDQLSPEEDAAYSRALFGDKNAVDENGNFVQGGCHGEALAAQSADDLYSDFQAEFEEQLATMYAAAQSDQRIVDANDEAMRCVAEKGYDQAQFEEDSQDALRAIQDRYEGGEMSDGLRSELAVLQAEELELAAVVWDCGANIWQREALVVEIYSEYEQEFLAENEDRMALYLEELGQG